MKNVLKIDHKNGKIIMDREFSIKSSTYGTQEYNHLQNARKDYPEYTVERKVIKKNSHKEAFKGLTYEYMEQYMERYKVDEATLQEYRDVRFDVKCHSIRYPYVKQWFLKRFPHVKNLGLTDVKANETDIVEADAADAAEVA
jgi:hypothetical protein